MPDNNRAVLARAREHRSGTKEGHSTLSRPTSFPQASIDQQDEPSQQIYHFSDSTQSTSLYHQEHFVLRTNTVVNDISTKTQSQGSYSQTSSNKLINKGGANQLQRWLYEVSNHNLTVAERLEKSNWEAERLERL